MRRGGVVVNEAMCFGLPISDVVGSGPDLAEEDINGHALKEGDIESIVDKLNIFVNNRGHIETFGKNSFDIVSRYDYDKDVEGIIKGLASIKT